MLEKQDLHFPEIFYDFYDGYIKVLVSKSRQSIVGLTQYLNGFRSIQKKLNEKISTLGQLNNKREYEGLKDNQ